MLSFDTAIQLTAPGVETWPPGRWTRHCCRPAGTWPSRRRTPPGGTGGLEGTGGPKDAGLSYLGSYSLTGLNSTA